MGIFSRFAAVAADPLSAPVTADPPSFAVDADSIDPAVFGLVSYVSNVAPAPKIDRTSAMQVPAFKRSRDLVCGVLGTLPLAMYDENHTKVVGPLGQLLEQPERHRPKSITFTQLIEDAYLEGVGWWQILELTGGWPSRVKRLKFREVTVDEQTERVYVNGKHVPDEQLIRFDSPNDPMLVAAARAVRTALMLEAATQRNSDGIPPIDYFTPADSDVDPGTNDEIKALLAAWDEANRQRKTGYVPAALKHNVIGWDPKQLQLAESRDAATLAIANFAGIDANALNVAVSTSTYFNAEHKRKEFLDFTLGGYITAIEGRLSMNDVCPPGYYVKYDLDAFLRSDAKTRMETYDIGLRVGAYTEPEIRELEDKPPLNGPIRALPAPSSQENAS